jgi:hypothetical protein
VKKSLGSGLLYNLNGLPEGWLNVVVVWLTHLLRIREVPGSNLGTETGNPEDGFGVFLSRSRQIQGYLKLGHDRFLVHPIEFIIHLSTFHSTLYMQVTEKA